jgi:dTDP-4-amino-4,6-dideoxygalactose transaminase
MAEMTVPLLDLKTQYHSIREEVRTAMDRVLDNQSCIGGPEIKQLEETLADYCGCKNAVAVSSGTDAILCALMALGIGEGDEVITTPFTFFATAGCIWRTGAKPVFVDIEPDTFNIDPAKIEAAVTDKTKAILPVHLYGQCAEMDPILAIAKKHNLYVIEDACQSIGSTYKDRPSGSMGTVGCLSFYPTKNLGGFGDGGMILTSDEALAEKMSLYRNHGMFPAYYYREIGGNFRLDTIQAAGLLVKAKYLNQWSDRRIANAKLYGELLAGLPGLITPVVRPYNRSVYNQYVIRVPGQRDELKAFLQENGIGSGIYYPLCLHEQDCFKSLGYKRGDFPESEQAAAEVLALPIFPELTDEQIRYAAGKVKAFLS